MNICKSIIALSVLMAFNPAMAEGIDFYGYMRAGVGVSADSGQNVRHATNQLGRLGNEDDVYGEIGIGTELYNVNGKSFYLDTMVAMQSDGSNDWEDTKSDDANFALRQFNIQATGLLGFAPEATLWAGKQFYQQHDVHITDFKYWDVSGAGAGVENINLGAGKLSVAWVRADSTSDTDGQQNVNILDARYAGIELFSNASLEVGIDYAIVNDIDALNVPDNVAENGVLLTAELTASQFLGGFNKTVIQWGNEGYASTMATYGNGANYDVDAASGAQGWRIINTGVVSPTAKIDISHQLLYGAANDVETNQNYDMTTFSAVVRPVYNWDLNNKTILEAGYYIESNKDVTDNAGTKFTLAQTWSAGDDFFARPEIRVYVSYVQDDQKVFAENTNDSEMSVGVQAEAWW